MVLSTAAKAGIGVGVAGLATGLVFLLIFLLDPCRPSGYEYYSSLDEKPGKDADWTVTDGKKIYLDEDVTLGVLVITDDATVLVAPGVTLVAGTIDADGGHFLVGLPDCPVGNDEDDVSADTPVNITLTGVADYMGQDPAATTLSWKSIAAHNGGSVHMYGKVRKPDWTRLVKNAEVGATQIHVAEPVTWRIGDHFVIASSDFEFDQAEERVVSGFGDDGDDKSIIKFEEPLENLHWGDQMKDFPAAGSFSESAEVGLLTRSILVAGDYNSPSDGFGGHTVLFDDGKGLSYEGVEFTRMGQQGHVGKYPVHWHRVGNRDGNFVRSCSLHHNFQRCVTIHGADFIKVEWNVAYDHVGHCFFLEDGLEEMNEFRYNLGLSTRRGFVNDVPKTALLDADNRASTFWIVNPNNTFIGNHAAGGDGHGIWLAIPDTPHGPSNPALLDAPAKAADMTPIYQQGLIFEDNTMHSYRLNGLHVDDAQAVDDPAGPTEVQSYRATKSNGPDSGANEVPVYFRRSNIYKCRNRGIWLRGGWQIIDHTTIADCLKGCTFASSSYYTQALTNSFMIGETENIGMPDNNEDRNYPHQATRHIRGTEFYDGPVSFENVTYLHWNDKETNAGFRKASGISHNYPDHFALNSRNFARDLRFDAESVVMHMPPLVLNGDKTSTMRDQDGSWTNRPGSTVTVWSPFTLVDSCTAYSGYQAAICDPDTHMELRMRNRDVAGTDASYLGTSTRPAVSIFRTSKPTMGHLEIWGTSPNDPLRSSFLVTAPRNEEYLFEYTHIQPSESRIEILRAFAGDVVSIGFRIADGSTINEVRRGSTVLSAEGSKAAMQAASGSSYFFDAATNIIWTQADISSDPDPVSRRSSNGYMYFNYMITKPSGSVDGCPRLGTAHDGCDPSDNACAERPVCGAHGYCPEGGSTCVCDSGWSGAECEDYDAGCPDDCNAGTCVAGNAATPVDFHCDCDAGHVGATCDIPLVDCAGTPECTGLTPYVVQEPEAGLPPWAVALIISAGALVVVAGAGMAIKMKMDQRKADAGSSAAYGKAPMAKPAAFGAPAAKPAHLAGGAGGASARRKPTKKAGAAGPGAGAGSSRRKKKPAGSRGPPRSKTAPNKPRA